MITRFILACFFTLLTVGGMSSDPVRNYSGMVNFLKEYLSIKYSGLQFDQLLYVAAKQQKMYLISGNEVVAEYPVSTAKNGLGSALGSNKTPEGLHIIKEKVGAEVPLGGIIKEKVFTGEVSEIISDPKRLGEDRITTRLFHLAGVESGVNKDGNQDSYRRGIMIHGTPEEGLIGQPVSRGCVRMRNEDILQLFRNVQHGTYVVILNN